MTHQWPFKLSLFLNYFVFAILLNSVGTVILQVQTVYGVSQVDASILEAFKDLSIAVTSFLIASLLCRFGYRNAMLVGLALVSACCLFMPLFPAFWMTKVLFAITGVSFALIKVSVYSCVGLVSHNKKDHASLMNFLESFFMVGVLAGYFFFSWFVDDANPQSNQWLNVYYLLAALSTCALLLLLFTPLDETTVKSEQTLSASQQFVDMLSLCIKPLVALFVISAFLYVLIEQSIMSWLPTFNSSVLNLSGSLSIQMASILAASTALGRFAAGIVCRYIDWYIVVTVCLVLSALLVLVTMPMAAQFSTDSLITRWADAPLAAYLFPLIGLCIAPIYPAINSTMLSALPLNQHGAMAGLIVVFSALGGTTGSIINGFLFESFGGQTAFYLSLVPIVLTAVTLYGFKRLTLKQTPVTASH